MRKRMTGKLGVGLWTVVLLTAASAVQLRYKLAVGQEHKYKDTITAEGTLTIDGPLGEQTLPITVTAETVRNLKVLEAAAGGKFVMESRTLSTKASARGGDDGGLGDTTMPPVNYKMKMDALGNVTDMEMIKADAGAASSVDLNLNEFASLGQVAGFPEDHVAVGGIWDKEVKIKTKDGQTVTAKTHNKLLSVNGADAKIECTYDVPIPATDGKMKLAGLEIPVRIQGHAAGKSTTLHNLDKGCVTRIEGTTVVDVKLSLMGLAAAPATGRFNVTMKSNLADD